MTARMDVVPDVVYAFQYNTVRAYWIAMYLYLILVYHIEKIHVLGYLFF